MMFYEQKVRDFKEAGIEYTIKQIDAYRALGVDGIHLYALNKWQDVSQHHQRVRNAHACLIILFTVRLDYGFCGEAAKGG